MSHTTTPLDGNPPLAALGQAPLVDIVSYGYKLAVKSLWPITKLTAPALFLFAVAMMLLKASGVDTYKITHLPPNPWILFTGLGLLLLVALPVLAYSTYVLMRFIRNLFREPAERTIGPCFVPDWTLLGCFLLMLLTWFAAVPALIVTVIGFLLFIIPGIIFLSAYSTMTWMVFAVYLQMPYRDISGAMGNIFEAIGRAFALLKGNFWRAVAISLLCGLINIVLQGMLGIPGFVLEVLEKLSPTLIHNPIYLAGYGLMAGLRIWFSLSLCLSAQMAVTYRFVCDLEARAAAVVPIEKATFPGARIIS